MHTNIPSVRARCHIRRLALSTSVLALTISPSLAQETAEGTESVVVTGSRIAEPGFTSPTPVQAVTGAVIDKVATTVGDALATLPSVVPTGGANQTASGVGAGGNGQATVNLRGLGSQRTLTLLDGQRFVGARGDGVPNIDLFPSGLIERVDIVTGGASAAYGSDAVAGVANFIIDKHYTGLKGSAEAGVSNYGDDFETKEVVTWGSDFLGGKAHVEANFEYYQSQGVREYDRWFDAMGADVFATGLPGPTNTMQPASISTATTQGGLVVSSTTLSGATSSLLKGTAFDANGQPYQFAYTKYSGGANQRELPNGQPHTVLGLYNEASETSPEVRGNAYVRASYDFNDRINVHADFLWGLDHNNYSGGVNYATGKPLAPVIKVDNAYLPAATRDAMIANGLQSITLGYEINQTPYRPNGTNHTYRATIGTDLKIGNDWTANLNYAHGETHYGVNFSKMLITPNWVNAIDAVTVTSANVGTSGLALGSVVCRSTLTAPTNGCVPFNAVGVSRGSPEAVDYVSGTESDQYHVFQDAFEGNITGPLFTEWAGDVVFAGGLNYRFDSYSQLSDAYSVTFNPYTNANGLWRTGNTQPSHGHNEVTEGYVEFAIPLLKGVPFAEDLDTDLAARFTDYRTSGSATTWKVGVNYQPIDDLRFRLTRSRDIRAPSLSELFNVGANGGAPTVGLMINQPGYGVVTTTSGTRTAATGNPLLTPEISNTMTYGAVITPTAVPGFSFSVDAYAINISKAISTPTVDQEVAFCNAGVTSNCAFFVYDNTGSVTIAYTKPFNFASYKVDGVDFEASYHFSLSDIWPDVGGNVLLHAVAGFIDHDENFTAGVAPIERAGDVGPNGYHMPKWKGSWQGQYDYGPYEAFFQVRFIGAGRFDNTLVQGVTIDNNTVPAAIYVDTNLKYTIPDKEGDWSVFLGINNLFNITPPLDPSTGNNPYRTQTALYDVVGRFFRLGVKFAY
ncbi:MAG TPA: TonB-dependent receptor [Rhizomicrobium sp.]|nr:TonB-dependent receptor [Rhizomicrobium sp.]